MVVLYGGGHSISDMERRFRRYRVMAEEMQGDHLDILEDVLNDIERRAQLVREETLRTARIQQPASTWATVPSVQQNGSSARQTARNGDEHVFTEASSISESSAAAWAAAARARNPLQQNVSSAGQTVRNGAERTIPQSSSVAQSSATARAVTTHPLVNAVQKGAAVEPQTLCKGAVRVVAEPSFAARNSAAAHIVASPTPLVSRTPVVRRGPASPRSPIAPLEENLSHAAERRPTGGSAIPKTSANAHSSCSARPLPINLDTIDPDQMPRTPKPLRIDAFGSPVSPSRRIETDFYNGPINSPIVTQGTLEYQLAVNLVDYPAPAPFFPENASATYPHEEFEIDVKEYRKSKILTFLDGPEIGKHIPECAYRPPFFDLAPCAIRIENGLVEWYDPKHPPAHIVNNETNTAASQSASAAGSSGSNIAASPQAAIKVEVIDLVSDSSSEGGNRTPISQQDLASVSFNCGRGMGVQATSPFAGLQGPAVQGTGVHLSREDYSRVDPALLDPTLLAFRDLNGDAQEGGMVREYRDF